MSYSKMYTHPAYWKFFLAFFLSAVNQSPAILISLHELSECLQNESEMQVLECKLSNVTISRKNLINHNTASTEVLIDSSVKFHFIIQSNE